ncbi:threonyl-tRNA synthetase editing domain-containing protein [Promethearchaeum syntrophicum]|uniref:Threonyl-tRNA synthetase editing domain-containing protein n=1 Tax=Promethearchaeum syntrophicum TaxID=2594042 RepID=A0A5B9D6J3_9ARCH|nr:threonyl-tRNA synthetase editing domain-containing protein [Candidatus Prometheoarchaeum syntrophicum]QEE14714.1 Threonine--tRNA ligase [Candidatus Prometheoarchaeum syntrophicum]
MRFLSFHVNSFNYKITKKGRSKILEEITEENKENQVENAIVLFIAAEKEDESSDGIFENVITEILQIVNQLKVKNIVLIPFAHLFGQLSSLDFAFESLKNIETLLKERDFSVIRMPFGWFSEFDMKAKGHPLSRISRIIN